MGTGLKIGLAVAVAGILGYVIYSIISSSSTKAPSLANGLAGNDTSGTTDTLLPTAGEIATDNTKATVRPVTNTTPSLSRGDDSNRPHEI